MENSGKVSDAVVKTFLLVSNIPYGGVGRRDTYISALENEASCSSKHQLLAELFKAMGVETKSMMGECDLRIFGETLDPTISLGRKVRDFHNFLMIKLDERWVRVDATFGKNEQHLNLPNNLNWNGQSDCRILFPVSRSWEVKDIFTSKLEALRELPLPERTLRDEFFQELSTSMLNWNRS